MAAREQLHPTDKPEFRGSYDAGYISIMKEFAKEYGVTVVTGTIDQNGRVPAGIKVGKESDAAGFWGAVANANRARFTGKNPFLTNPA